MFIAIKRFRKDGGFTLTEAAIVLGIVGLILGAIWVAAASVYSNMRVNTANRQLVTIVQNVRSLYASSALMDASTTAQLASAGVFPNDTNPSTGAPKNGWGGNITVARGTQVQAGDSFVVTFVGVPQAACVDMAVANSGSGRDAGLIGVGAAAAYTTVLTSGYSVSSALGGPCANATGNSNTLAFTFKLKG